jgi:hypothetical protein
MNRRRDDLEGIPKQMFKLISGIYGICNDYDWELSREQQELVCKLYMSIMGAYLNTILVRNIRLSDATGEIKVEDKEFMHKLLEKNTEFALKFLIDPNSVVIVNKDDE